MILAASRYSPEFIEGLLALFSLGTAVTMLPVRPRVREMLASRSSRFVAIYLAVLIAATLLTILFVRDILAPNQTFRRTMVIAALTIATAGFPVWFLATVRSKGAWVRNVQSRGFNGRALPSIIAACWFGCAGVWIIEIFPHADRAFILASVLGVGTFFALAISTSSLGQPAFLVPVGVRGRHFNLPDLVTVVADRGKDAGWHGWSTDLNDLDLNAATLDGLDRAAQAYLHDRFATTDRTATTTLQFLAEMTSSAPADFARAHDIPKEQLFEAERHPGGGYLARSVERPNVEVTAATLDELLSRAAASGSHTVRLSWSHDIQL